MKKNLKHEDDYGDHINPIEVLTVSTEYMMCAVRDIYFGEPLESRRVQDSLRFAYAKLNQYCKSNISLTLLLKLF